MMSSLLNDQAQGDAKVARSLTKTAVRLPDGGVRWRQAGVRVGGEPSADLETAVQRAAIAEPDRVPALVGGHRRDDRRGGERDPQPVTFARVRASSS